jgi:hypothetical protein
MNKLIGDFVGKNLLTGSNGRIIQFLIYPFHPITEVGQIFL